MQILVFCGIGFIFSFFIGSIFSQSGWLTPFVLATYTFFVRYLLFLLKLNRPPGHFFFVMIASIAISTPQSYSDIPQSLITLSMGVGMACLIGLIYSYIILRRCPSPLSPARPEKTEKQVIRESIISGAAVGLAMLAALLLELEKPYWVPTSCLAVMAGISTQHVWIRAVQRVCGTLMGLGLTWLILQSPLSTLQICVCIVLLQVTIEYLVVRNYALAAIFITTLTIMLAESGSALAQNPNHLFQARFFDILLGSVIGVIGGWILHHERIQVDQAVDPSD